MVAALVIDRLKGVDIADVDGVESKAEVVAVKAEPHGGTSVKTLGDKALSLVDDLVGGDGITRASLRKQFDPASGAESDIAINRHAIQVGAIGKMGAVDVTGAIELGAQSQAEAPSGLKLGHAANTVVVGEVVHEDATQVVHAQLSQDVQADISDTIIIRCSVLGS